MHTHIQLSFCLKCLNLTVHYTISNDNEITDRISETVKSVHARLSFLHKT